MAAENILFIIPFVGRLLGEAGSGIYLWSLMPLIWTAAAAAASRGLAIMFAPDSYADLALIGLAIVVPYGALAALTLPQRDRVLLAGEARAVGAMLSWRRRS